MRNILLASLILVISATVNAAPRDDWHLIANAIEQTGNIDAANKIRQSIDTLSDEQLQAVYGDVALAALAAKITYNAQVTDQILSDSPRLREMYKSTLGLQDLNSGNLPLLNSTGLPDAKDYPTTGWCPTSPERSNASDVEAAQVAVDVARGLYDAAKAIWDGASRACDETLVILGEGGNTSLACIPVDIVFAVIQVGIYAAETTLEHVAFCDAVIDSAEIEGSYERAGHIHSDLETHQNTLILHDQALATHDQNISQQLDTHDVDIKARLDDLEAKIDILDGKVNVMMARQLETIRLLVTPTGRRVTDVPACDGGPCDFPDE